MSVENAVYIANELDIPISPEEREKISIPPTKSLHIYMIFCRGLDAMDNGEYKKAIDYFYTAIEKDPDFKRALDEFKRCGKLLKE